MINRKIQLSKLLTICKERWPDELKQHYTAAQVDFRDWLNEKTGLNVDQRYDTDDAVDAWLNALEAQS